MLANNYIFVGLAHSACTFPLYWWIINTCTKKNYPCTCSCKNEIEQRLNDFSGQEEKWIICGPHRKDNQRD